MVRAMIDALKEDRCPDCGGFIFRPGPQGGISQNIECVGCGNRFNVTRDYHTLDEILAGGERVVTQYAYDEDRLIDACARARRVL
jgi:hypothetical protein